MKKIGSSIQALNGAVFGETHKKSLWPWNGTLDSGVLEITPEGAMIRQSHQREYLLWNRDWL